MNAPRPALFASGLLALSLAGTLLGGCVVRSEPARPRTVVVHDHPPPARTVIVRERPPPRETVIIRDRDRRPPRRY